LSLSVNTTLCTTGGNEAKLSKYLTMALDEMSGQGKGLQY